MQENVGYINEKVREMYGIPYNELTPEQKKILHEDSLRRSKLIRQVEKDVLEINKVAFATEAELEEELAKLYKQALDEILSSVMQTIAKLEKSGGEWSYANQSALTRNRGLFDQIQDILQKLTDEERLVFYEQLSDIYTDQFLREIYSLGQVTTVKANFNLLNPDLVKKTIEYPWSGDMFSDRLWLDKERLLRTVRSALTSSMILGESVPQITQRITKAMDSSRYNAERVARTETKRVSYVAHVEAFKSTGVKQVKYRCANGVDERTCKTCKADNDKVYDLGKEPTLPRHPNCRCVYIPVVGDEFKPNELNELTGSIRGAENYNKWVEHYREVLNPDGSLKEGWETKWRGRAKPVTVYTTKDGEELTLEEYRKRIIGKGRKL